ncbi:non-specific lipid-transfer protein 2-like [Cynara cardunculus var. scolymus]|uniref:Bifunctional inhibitor/plant lipid transfer protein/seed storage helical domain-containing protein n=1 Tax=Cynara cardunculus var. scolymus TaxID=59895 RepID=A0A103Y599_CYNCS|nr:non-specific lipid-transfer protein 2-like [Cynara cardunculus var. scolymus]KVI02786.1 Bifunctional inhibitor/plant lipid transfer protein/seed storage helical domain-containing protein [Cynara cardunculus var. scolymus]
MKGSTKVCCVVVLYALTVVLMGHVPTAEAANCNYMELVVCAGAITSPQPPSRDCCAKVKEQRPCFCGYLQNPSLRQYVTPDNARRVARQCGVVIPKC